MEWPEPVKRSGSSSSHTETPDEFDDDWGEEDEEEFESETDDEEDFEVEGQKHLSHLKKFMGKCFFFGVYCSSARIFIDHACPFSHLTPLIFGR